MKATQVSWIDVNQVSALAHGLLRVPEKRLQQAAQAVMPESVADSLSFVFPDESEELAAPIQEVSAEPESPPVLHDFRAKLQAIRDRAVHAGLIPAQMPVIAKAEEDELPVFKPLAGPVSDRLSAFIDWAKPVFNNAEIFIVDDQGDLHWGTPANSGLVLSAIMAWGAASRMSALAAYETAEPLRQILASDRHLAVIPCATRLGIMHVAITSSALIPVGQISSLRDALVAAMDADD